MVPWGNIGLHKEMRSIGDCIHMGKYRRSLLFKSLLKKIDCLNKNTNGSKISKKLEDLNKATNHFNLTDVF